MNNGLALEKSVSHRSDKQHRYVERRRLEYRDSWLALRDLANRFYQKAVELGAEADAALEQLLK